MYSLEFGILGRYVHLEKEYVTYKTKSKSLLMTSISYVRLIIMAGTTHFKNVYQVEIKWHTKVSRVPWSKWVGIPIVLGNHIAHCFFSFEKK